MVRGVKLVEKSAMPEDSMMMHSGAEQRRAEADGSGMQYQAQARG